MSNKVKKLIFFEYVFCVSELWHSEAFSALMLLVSSRKGIVPVKTECDTGMVVCLKRDANDLHIVQLMPLPPHHLLLFKIQNGLPFWCRLSQVVLEKGC